MGATVIVGAGIAGLSAALTIGRQGRPVVLCERDAAPAPTTTEEMWTSWPRPGVPQARLGHTFLPRFYTLLRDRLPDVLERLWQVGAVPWDIGARLQSAERLPEDGDLTAIMCRRPVLEGVLRQAVEAEPSVEVRTGCHVAGLLAAPAPSGIPRVVGVHVRDHDTIAAERVVVAGGRHVPVAAWLGAIGARVPAEIAEGCGQLWYSRYFRLCPRDGEDLMVTTQLTIECDLGYMMYEIFGADQRSFVMELGVPTGDKDLRGLHHVDAFMAVARSMPEAAAWLDCARSTPIGTVAAMGQERNLLRQFVCEGHPIALGLHVIGDSRCRTNSVYAWGAGLACAQAITLADILVEHPDDPLAQALAFEARTAGEVAGWHHLAVERDRARQRAYRGDLAWDAASDAGEDFVQTVVIPAAEQDNTVLRAVTRQWTQLDPPGALVQNTTVHERARALNGERRATMEPPAGPSREQIVEMLQRARP